VIADTDIEAGVNQALRSVIVRVDDQGTEVEVVGAF
jgi:hypothetical protein